MNLKHVAAAVAASALVTSAASAQCARGLTVKPDLDPAVATWEFEGPITGYDTAAGTISVLGAAVQVPATLPIVTGPDYTVSYAQLTDPALEATRTIVGGILIASGSLADTDADGCYDLVADAAEFLFDENVIVGALPLNSVDAASGTFWMAGTAIQMNTDPRIPSLLLDASSNPDITIADLQGFEGRIMSPEGYYENGAIRGAVVETDAYNVNPDGDNVIVIRSLWESDKQNLKVLGYVEPRGAAYVDIYDGTESAANPEVCEGTFLARVATFEDPDALTQARFVWDSGEGTMPIMPAMTCTQSPGGDATRSTVVDKANR